MLQLVVELPATTLLAQEFMKMESRLGIDPPIRRCCGGKNRRCRHGWNFRQKVARRLAAQTAKPTLIIANNGSRNVPDLNDFCRRQSLCCCVRMQCDHRISAPAGTHRARRVDTIYHEHYSYFSLYAIEQVSGAMACGYSI